MFDIKIGTVLPGDVAPAMMRQLNGKGYESYQLSMNGILARLLPVIREHAAAVTEAAEGRVISLGYYANPLVSEEDAALLKDFILAAPLYGATVVGTFAGGNPELSVPENIPAFQKVFGELCKVAESVGVRIALEGCGAGWYKGCTNLAYCPAAWDLMFEAVPSPALTLEWEPAHAVTQLMDPVAQLRRYAGKVSHIHGKDGTVAWDVLRDNGPDAGIPYRWDRTPGFGDSNWADFFTILLMAGFEGCCDIEGYHDPVHYDDVEWSSQLVALDYLKRCRGGVTEYPGPTEYRGYQGTRKKG